jgi:ribonuclease HI
LFGASWTWWAFSELDGGWIKGYMRKIGTCDTLRAEMWGIYLKMQLVWRQVFHQLQVKSDSKTQFDMITWKVKINGNPPTLVRRIQEFLKLN